MTDWDSWQLTSPCSPSLALEPLLRARAESGRVVTLYWDCTQGSQVRFSDGTQCDGIYLIMSCTWVWPPTVTVGLASAGPAWRNCDGMSGLCWTCMTHHIGLRRKHLTINMVTLYYQSSFVYNVYLVEVIAGHSIEEIHNAEKAVLGEGDQQTTILNQWSGPPWRLSLLVISNHRVMLNFEFWSFNIIYFHFWRFFREYLTLISAGI